MLYIIHTLRSLHALGTLFLEMWVSQYNVTVRGFFLSVHLCGWWMSPFDPRHDKTFLREFPTRPDTNRPAQPQTLARVLKFRLLNLEILYYLNSEQQRR